MATESGEDELLGGGVPVEVDGETGSGAEALADGDVRREDPWAALMYGRVVLGVLQLGGEADVVAVVCQAGLLGQVVRRIAGVSRVAAELGVGDQIGEVARQGAVVLEGRFLGPGQGLVQDDDVLLEVGLAHEPAQDVDRRFEGALDLSDLRLALVDGLHELAPDQRTAETAGIGNAARCYVDRDMPLRHEVEVDRGAVGEERDDGLGAIEGRPGDAFEDRAGEIADPAAQDRRRGLRAVVPSEVGGAHGYGE